MKICVVSSSVIVCPPPGYSGLEMIAWQTAKGLAQLGHEVSLVAPDGSSCPGVTVVPSGPAGQWDERQAFKRYFEHLLSVDCVIDHSWSKHALSLRQSGQLKAPVLCVMHAPIPGMLQSLPPVEKPCFVCISHDQANHFDALFNMRPEVCYNGVSTSFYRDLKIGRTDRFLFLARYSTIKGPDLAIQACLQAGVGLDLVGDTTITNEPEYFHQCMALAEQQSPGWDVSKGKQIRVHGGVSRSETVHWYSRAYAMLHPNMRFREPFGLAPVEAMLCGCPCIGWEYGAMRETLGTNVGGICVRTVDELAFWVRDWANSRNVLGDSSEFRSRVRKHAEQFSVERMCKRYLELCEKAIQTGGW